MDALDHSFDSSLRLITYRSHLEEMCRRSIVEPGSEMARNNVLNGFLQSASLKKSVQCACTACPGTFVSVYTDKPLEESSLLHHNRCSVSV